MRMKGMEMPVNTVIVIALAVMVLLMLAMFFFGGTKQWGGTGVESAWSQGCNVLRNTYHCDASTVGTIKTADITGDGVPDSLHMVCKVKYHNDDVSAEWCRNKCCGTRIVEGSPCNVQADCQFGWGRGNWVCESTAGADKGCCPAGKAWNGTVCKK